MRPPTPVLPATGCSRPCRAWPCCTARAGPTTTRPVGWRPGSGSHPQMRPTRVSAVPRPTCWSRGPPPRSPPASSTCPCRRAPALVPPRPGEEAVPLRGALPPGRGGPRGLPGLVDVCGVRHRPPSPRGRRCRVVPPIDGRDAGEYERGCRGQPVCLVSDPAHRRRADRPHPFQSHGRLPLHQDDGGDHGRRHGSSLGGGQPRSRRIARRPGRASRLSAGLGRGQRSGLRRRARSSLGFARHAKSVFGGAGYGRQRHRRHRPPGPLQLLHQRAQSGLRRPGPSRRR